MIHLRHHPSDALIGECTMRKKPAKPAVALAALLVALLGLPTPLFAKPIPAREVVEWLDWDLIQIISTTIGPEGAQIFPLWSSDSDKIRVEGVLLRASAELDIGVVVSAVLEVYLDPMDMRPRAVAFEPQAPVSLEDIEGYFGASPDRRLCRPAEVEIPLDAPLVPADKEGEGVVEEAVFPQIRMIAEMFQEEDVVTRLRWVSREKSLEGCP